jgi:hypothetical protein
LTPQETLKPEPQEGSEGSGENSEAKYRPMRELDAKPELKSEHEKTAALPHTTVRRATHTVAVPARKLDDSGWRASR